MVRLASLTLLSLSICFKLLMYVTYSNFEQNLLYLGSYFYLSLLYLESFIEISELIFFFYITSLYFHATLLRNWTPNFQEARRTYIPTYLLIYDISAP